MAERPKRCQLPDFSGSLLTLSDAPQNWSRLSTCQQSRDVLLCGLGPGTPETLPFLAKARHVFWIDAPETVKALNSGGYCQSIPAGWQKADPTDLDALCGRCDVWFYRANLRLAPDFWGKLLGRLESARFCHHAANPRPDRQEQPVILPGNNGQLMHPCLQDTLGQMGFSPIVTTMPDIPPGQSMGTIWDGILGGVVPRLVLAVNGRGLDGEGHLFQFFRALGAPVAIWFVDNPWHVISGWRIPWWKNAYLFVTDKSFIAPLQAAGAQYVWHLPLAAAPHMLHFGKQHSGQFHRHQTSPLFVGRSTFPNRERFFAAAKVPQDILATALHCLEQAGPPADTPHFHWWCGQLQPKPWPSQDVRNAGYGAEQCALANRIRWLKAGLQKHMSIIGDAGWHSAFPSVRIAPPVDYYIDLPRLYAAAQCVLHVTSLLLPHSLSQRHFDVWAAGGSLLSDATQGLEIFPDDLASPIIVHHPDQLADKITELTDKPTFYADLKNAWQEHIQTKHTYTQRVQTILDLTAEAGSPK